MNEKISIIIPIYNTVTEQLIRCLDSVLNQDYNNIELILVDDGSQDSTKIIINEYAHKDNRIKAIYQENSGVSVARNNGLQHAC